MRPDVAEAVRGAELSGWTPVEIEFGDRSYEVLVPPRTRVLEMKETAPLADPADAIRAALARPIGSAPLAEIVRAKGKPAAALTVAVTTSDITRPVPYRGEGGILGPLLASLAAAGVPRENVTLVVGTGTHRPSTADEKARMFGADVAGAYRVVDHDCDDASRLVALGRTRAGTEILVNRDFALADVRIATGLVESHFMAGVSGGRKAVCPALVSRRTIERFHSVDFLDSEKATNLVLEGNPCHEESREIARKVGVDFAVSAVLDRRLRLVGVFAGELEQSHLEAYRMVKGFAAIPVERPADVVLTHGGYVGINHYQNAKAACNALPAVRRGGFVVLAACERDQDPVGPLTYRSLLHLLKLQGWEGYLAMLRAPGFRFTRDQWEPQMWGKVLAKIGEEGLVYCSPILDARDYEIAPGQSGRDYLDDPAPKDALERARSMVQNAVVACVRHPRWRGEVPTVAFVREGPYAVPTEV
jgi:nickel-dependent lactate racemase